jgi:hypothetical protein
LFLIGQRADRANGVPNVLNVKQALGEIKYSHRVRGRSALISIEYGEQKASDPSIRHRISNEPVFSQEVRDYPAANSDAHQCGPIGHRLSRSFTAVYFGQRSANPTRQIWPV